MSHFVTPLDCRKLPEQREGRALWKLLAPLVYVSDGLRETITVPASFITDFASVPRLPLAYLMAGDTAHEAAVVHDWLYTTHGVEGKPITRAQADATFREAIAAAGGQAPGWLMWAAVRLGGRGSWGADGPDQPEHVATAIDHAGGP